MRVCCIVLLLSLVACAPDRSSSIQQTAAPVSDGGVDPPSTRALLAFLNDPATDRRMLDHIVGLDRRAAMSLLAWRDGPDRQAGTDDDGVFRSLQDVDAIPFVGPVTIRMMTEWALAHGYDDPMLSAT